MIMKCELCQRNRSANTKEPMLSHAVPELPYQKIAMDILQFGAKNFLVISDYYSRYIDLIMLANKTAPEIIRKLKNNFANHGLPREIVADNMPFNSFEFKKFSHEYDIVITTSSPTYPQSNGFAEKAVGICKNLLKKTPNMADIWLSLLEYRNTPLKEINASPVELLMGRKTRTPVLAKIDLFRPQVIPNIKNNIENKNKSKKKYYDRNAKNKLNFEKGDKVWYQEKKGSWVMATIMEKHNTPRSYWIGLEDGTVLRRNSGVLRCRIDY